MSDRLQSFLRKASWCYELRTAPMLYVTATLLYLIGDLDPLGAWALYPVIAAACVFLIWPRRPTFTLFCLIQILWVWQRLPFAANHMLLSAVFAVGFLSAEAYRSLIKRDRNSSLGDVLTDAAPVVRTAVLVLYFFAFFHKLNAGYFSIQYSCAIEFFHAAPFGYAFRTKIPGMEVETGAFFRYLVMQPAAAYLVIAATLAVELAIPILLMRRQWVRWGVLLGVLFHGVIAFRLLESFSVLMGAAYLFFLSANGSEAQWRDGHRRYGRLLFAPVIAMILAAVFGLRGYLPQDLNRMVSLYLLGLPVVFAAAAWFDADRLRYLPSGARMFRGLALVLALALAVNASGPYLGLRTTLAFNMFSNLRTEGAAHNHFFVPSGPKLFDYQEQLVKVERLSGSGNVDPSSEGVTLPRFELGNIIKLNVRRGASGIHLRWHDLMDGKTYELENAETHPELGVGANVVQSKLLSFKGLHPHPDCVW